MNGSCSPFAFAFAFVLAFALATSVGHPALAQSHRDQDHLREAAAQGHVVRLDKIVTGVQSRAPYRAMTYLGGAQFDASTMQYALKFLDGRRLVIVYVDARTGRIVGHHP